MTFCNTFCNFVYLIIKSDMRQKLKEHEKKTRITISLNQILDKKLTELHTNVSKHVEWLIYQDMRKNNQIDEMPL